MADQYLYGTAVHLQKPIIKAGSTDFANTGDWTPVAGDVKISKDLGAAANVTNLPTATAMGNGSLWDFSLTAAEMQARKVRITVCDAATKAVTDVSFEIDTYGDPSAQHIWMPANIAPGAANGLPLLDSNLSHLTNVSFRGTASAGGANTITLAGAVATDNFYKYAMVMIVGGTGAGQVRTILDYVGSTKVATVAKNWATNPDNTSVFVILPQTVPGVLSSGIAQAGGASTITLQSTASATNDIYKGETISIYSGTGLVQSRTIIGYVGATKVATVDEAWATNPDATSVYEIGAIGRAYVGQLTTAAIAALWAQAGTELAAVPGPTASMLQMLEWIFAVTRNARTQTATTELLLKDDGVTTLGTSTKSDDSVTFIRGEYS